MKQYKNKKSFLIIFIVLFWLTYSLVSILLFVNEVEEIYYRERIRRQELILYHIDSNLNLMLDKQFEVLRDNLFEAYKLNHFGFAVLVADNEEPYILSRYQGSEAAINYEPTGGMVEVDNFFINTVRIDDIKLTIGTRIEKWTLIEAYLTTYLYKILFDIFLVTLLSGALIYFVMRDLIALTNIFKNKSRDFKSIAPTSLEAQILLSATQSYQLLTDALGSQAHLFASSLGSAIVTELRRGTVAPTSFETVLVRVDLNQYTKTYLSTDLKDMTKTLNIFFETARICIERYDGLIYEYVGDEILFLLKVKENLEKNETFKQAFCCVRDIFTDINELKRLGKLPANISAKASLSQGILNFVKLDQGYSYSGVPLIETARLLNFINEKELNTLIIEASQKNNVLEFVESFDEKSAQLKGFDNEFNLLEAKNFKTVNPLMPKYFRSSFALEQTFVQIQELLKFNKIAEIMALLAELRSVTFGELNTNLAKEFFKTLDVSTDASYDVKVLSSLVSLARNFVPSTLPLEFETVFHKILKHENPRVKANCVITLSHFDPELDIQLTFEDKTSNRLFADILFVLGKKAIDKHLVNEIEFMTSHKEKLYKASGLYISSALLQYHLEKDRVYFDSNPQFSRLKKFLKNSLNDRDPDIRKHAEGFEQVTGEKL